MDTDSQKYTIPTRKIGLCAISGAKCLNRAQNDKNITSDRELPLIFVGFSIDIRPQTGYS